MPTRPDPEDVDREEIEAVLETRRELGASYEPALVDSFAEKIERAIDARVAERTGGREGRQSLQGPRDAKAHDAAGNRQMILGFVSLGTGIPISAIAGEMGGGLPGLIVAWAGIVGINVAHAWQNRSR